LLTEGTCRIENVPNVHDVSIMLDIMQEMGVKIKLLSPNCYEINSDGLTGSTAPYELARRIRASYYLVGSCLGRLGSAEVAMPGGCDFGERPIDQHLTGFRALGAQVEVRGGSIVAHTPKGLSGGMVYLDNGSVGATINVMLAASLSSGTTVIENAGKEPHIVDLANFLNYCGAEIRGAGTDVIKIRGKEKLTGGCYSIIPDQIEAGTFMTAAAAAGGDLILENVIPKHLECISVKLREMGVGIEEYDDAVRICSDRQYHAVSIRTMPYPGFPTDMNPQIAAVLSMAEGTSMITERVWENRYRYVNELRRMGANIQVDGRVAVVKGVNNLSGAPVQACDLRAGAALVIAGLAAWGNTVISDVFQIERGYEDMAKKLRQANARIKREEVTDADYEHIQAVL
jgi:UDP-N-acetylglucosamine 1-carboxyvinyltransferase